MQITRQRQRFSSRVVKFASQVLYSMWVHQELREVYRKAGWKETDFVTKTIAARNARPNSPTNMNSTLNRPMASQSGTRYEDRTMQRGGGGAGGGLVQAHHANNAGAVGYRVRNRATSGNPCKSSQEDSNLLLKTLPSSFTVLDSVASNNKKKCQCCILYPNS